MTNNVLPLTAVIVSAHVRRNKTSSDELLKLIQMVHGALSSVGGPAKLTPKEPAVPISKSIEADYLVCLEDGMKLKMLKRHLRNAYDMTPDEYRKRWGLSPEYPMVAPNYSKRRSSLAKSFGLGKKRD